MPFDRGGEKRGEMAKIKVTLAVELDTEMLCDEESLRTEFDNDWGKCITSLYEEDKSILWDEELKIVKTEIISE